jgi:glycosyltransferase involved in cell wall biosynthesis
LDKIGLMRIALVVTGGFDRSGRERVIPSLLWLVERLARRHQVAVYVLRHEERPVSYQLLGADVHDLGRPKGALRQRRALEAALRRDGPFDVIHAWWALPAGFAAARVARRLDVPCIVSLDTGEFVAMPEIDYGLQLRWRQRYALASTIKRATELTVSTGYMRALANPHGAKPFVIPLGVDSTLFRPCPMSVGPPWRLVHVASLSPVKDQGTLLEAFRLIADRLPNVHLDIVGEDTMGGAAQARAKELRIDTRVTFHGFLPSEELVPIYQRAHLHLVSSLHEAAGVVTLEAAACGVPTVGTAVGYVADWSPDRAVAVPPGDAWALATAVVGVLDDEGWRRRLAAAARQFARQFDADWTADRFARLYAQSMSAR